MRIQTPPSSGEAHNREKCSRWQLASYFIAFILIYTNAALADGSSHKIPGIDREPAAHQVPADLQNLPTEEITSIRTARQKDLEKLRNGADSKEVAEEYMLEQLLLHDSVRLKIIDVIPQIIEDYAIEGKFKETLMGYRSTFDENVSELRKGIKNLKDYQAYDFRFAAVYMSMLFAFQEHPEFYKRLKADMVDENTSIGDYRKRLDDSYGRVELAKAQMDAVHSAEDLENVIATLDEELARRKQ